MCGITGIVRFDQRDPDPDALEAMTDAIQHRGPDGEGQAIDGSTGLGNRRLAILDLSDAGAQPMATPDGRYTITYNGETYNYRDLRERLEKLGHDFSSDTDTEVVLHAYAEWGAECLDELNGMFAFAVWDRREEELFLARDRYGVKLLYVHQDGNRLLFGSELKALLAHGTVDREVDPYALREYFTFQNLFSSRTLMKDVRRVPAGHFVRIDPEAGIVESEEYWDYDFTDKIDPDKVSREECAQEVRDRFEQAVRRQLVSDVPVGSFLSGGMDSGSIVAVASHEIPRLRTYTAGFDTSTAEGPEADFDERDAAERMASEFDTEHHERFLHAGDMPAVLDDVVRSLENPRVGMCWQNYCVQDLASRSSTVVLSGAGGDELFGGYPWRYDRVRDASNHEEFEQAYFDYWQRLVPREHHEDFFTDDVLDATEGYDPLDDFQGVLADADVPEDEPLDKAFYFELKTFLPGLFALADKLSMAHSLEARVPFLDNDLVEYAQKIPTQYKVTRDDPDVEVEVTDHEHQGEEFTLSNEGKQVLRDAMEGLIPAEVRLKDKQGFSPPDASWYRSENRQFIEALLLDDQTLDRGYIEEDAIRNILEDHSSGRANHRLVLWSLIFFEVWCRRFLDHEDEHLQGMGERCET